jgi:hypothetical protein
MAAGCGRGGGSRAGSNHPALACASAAPPYPRRGLLWRTYVAIYSRCRESRFPISWLPLVRRLRIPKMRDIRIAIHCQAARGTRPMKTRRMEREDGCVHDVPLVRDNHTIILNRVTDLPGHDQPELSAFGVIMSAIFFIERRKILLIPVDDVGDGSIVMNEAATRVVRGFG